LAPIEDTLTALLRAANEGDARAYRAFLETLGRQLRAFFRNRLSARPDAVEDLVQDTLLAVHVQRHTWDPERPLRAWVLAIARYKLVDSMRAHGRRDALHEPLDDESEWLASSAAADAHEARRDLARLLGHLPERQRAPIVHMKLEGLSVIETAALTGQSESAVKVGVHRGLKALTARLRGSAG
jgi:RNA polymerase sigma-70 factor (ECF subfamily)